MAYVYKHYGAQLTGDLPVIDGMVGGYAFPPTLLPGMREALCKPITKTIISGAYAYHYNTRRKRVVLRLPTGVMIAFAADDLRVSQHRARTSRYRHHTKQWTPIKSLGLRLERTKIRPYFTPAALDIAPRIKISDIFEFNRLLSSVGTLTLHDMSYKTDIQATWDGARLTCPQLALEIDLTPKTIQSLQTALSALWTLGQVGW